VHENRKLAAKAPRTPRETGNIKPQNNSDLSGQIKTHSQEHSFRFIPGLRSGASICGFISVLLGALGVHGGSIIVIGFLGGLGVLAANLWFFWWLSFPLSARVRGVVGFCQVLTTRRLQEYVRNRPAAGFGQSHVPACCGVG
jgi:hypothetical protein